MKIAVWFSGHEISDKICNAIKEGLPNADLIWSHPDNYMTKIKDYDLHIAYGILRGCAEIFKRAESFGIPYIEIDKGYWKPSHYTGYYRISLSGTQQTFGLDKLEPDYERWDKLGLEILPARKDFNDDILCCNPTKYVAEFFGVADLVHPLVTFDERIIYRDKGSNVPLQQDLDNCTRVVTFNSSVGWEALRQGIPVISDPTHSILGAYQKMVDRRLHTDLDARRRLFAVMSSLQLNLAEIRSGKLWPLIKNLLKCTSVTIPASL